MDTFTVGGLTVHMEEDDMVESPRKDRDNFGHLWFATSRYQLGDKNCSTDELVEMAYDDSVVAIMYVSFADHGELSVREVNSGDATNRAFSGILFATQDDVEREYGKVDAESLVKVMNLLRAELHEFDMYLRNDVWCYRIVDELDNTLDSCCGFYGYDYAKREASETAERLWAGILKEREDLAYRAD